MTRNHEDHVATLPGHATPGYDYGSVPRSPVSCAELDQLEQTVEFTDEDRRYLKMASEFLPDHAEEMVGAWRARIGKQPHLARWFYGPDGKPDERYKSAVKARFVRWVIDLVTRPFDQQWLDYQEEIGRRHTPEKKNQTDRADSPMVVPLRYLFAFVSVVILTAPEFLARGRHS